MKNHDDEKKLSVYEDWAYNFPRHYESFWPQSKVTSVQTNGQMDDDSINNLLSPKCFVTGDGCTISENPSLHLPSSRYVMDFEAPTRRSGRLVQSTDVALIDSIAGMNFDGSKYLTCRTFTQYNLNQDLQTFYKEVISLHSDDGDERISGKVRVAAFLPYWVKEMDGMDENLADAYDENEAVALYDYDIRMQRIDSNEAAMI